MSMVVVWGGGGVSYIDVCSLFIDKGVELSLIHTLVVVDEVYSYLLVHTFLPTVGELIPYTVCKWLGFGVSTKSDIKH